uniref:Pyrroline-5-carboxylate reductase catalytic N-terminal domain-containing protein n=1 Tax=Vitrella brassicaformis TaxID=1169539 RepID=A0A7S1JNF3_9ALVE
MILRYLRHAELLPSPRCLAVSTRRADELRGSPLVKGLHLCVFDNAKVAAFADLLIVAVPPYQLDAVSIDLRGSLRKGTVVVNLAAGTPRRKSQVLFDPAYALRPFVDLADPRVSDTPMEHPIGSFLRGVLVENRSAASIVGGKMAHTVNRKLLQKSKALAAAFLAGSDETLISFGEALMGHCEVANTNDIKYVRSALMSPSPAASSTTHDQRASPDAAHEAEGDDGESLWHFTQEERLRFERQFVELVPTIDPEVLLD